MLLNRNLSYLNKITRNYLTNFLAALLLTKAARFSGFVLIVLTVSSANAFSQQPPAATRIWSVGPLTKSDPVMGFSVGPDGASITGPQIDTQTRSIFSATRSIVFAGNRIVLASKIGTKMVKGAAAPQQVYKILSLDIRTGKVMRTREVSAFGSLEVFATNDSHIILSGHDLLRLSPDLEDAGTLRFPTPGHKLADVENISPDGSTLGNQTSPGFELINAETFKPTELTADPSYSTSNSSLGFVTDNVHWVRDYPKDTGFVTYVDASGKHLVYHGMCGGRPQFLTNDLIFEPGCSSPLIMSITGTLVRTLPAEGSFSYAGASQDGKRFAIQLTSSSAESILKERFAIYSVDAGTAVTEVPGRSSEGQSWTAFSADGSMFVVGSPSQLSLYRLP